MSTLWSYGYIVDSFSTPAQPADHCASQTRNVSTHTSPDTHRPTTESDSETRLTDAAPPADSWAACCQCQFGHRRTAHLRNCVDAENAAMPDS